MSESIKNTETTAVDEEKEQLSYSAAQINIACGNAIKLHYGSETAAVKSAAVVMIKLSGITGFVPKQVVVSLRIGDTPTPYRNIVCTLYKSSGTYYAVLVCGANQGSNTYEIPSGTYIVDWIAAE